MSLQISPIKNSPSKVQLERLGHVYFEHPDLAAFEGFAKDFGLVEATRVGDKIYYRGYGRDPYVYVASKSKDGQPRFGGAAFVARSQEEFDKAAHLPGAKVQDMGKDVPGGGKRVTFERPNGTFMHVLFGQQERTVDESKPPPSETHVAQGPYNTPFEKKRRGEHQRYHPGPALVHKIGHLGYVCKEFDEELSFYTSNFNFIASDILHDGERNDVDIFVFLRLDLGKDYSDHHIMFIQRAPPEVPRSFLHHTSYEVADFDTQLIGHEHLANQGWKLLWGVGRHVAGSQIFDYWQDPTGFKVEHYSDGDVLNEDNSPNRLSIGGQMSAWGPALPKEFFEDTTLAMLQQVGA